MKLIGYYNYTVIATYLGLCSAVGGILFTTQGKTKEALLLLMIAGALDMVDGKIASTRARTKDEKLFGIQIDSLCDLISFGVLPACILCTLHPPVLLSAAASVFLILGGVIRLSYFNVTEIARQNTSVGSRQFYEGLPITSTALLLPAAYLLRAPLGNAFPVLFSVFSMAVAFAFVLPFRLKKPHGVMLFVIAAAGLAVLLLNIFLGV